MKKAVLYSHELIDRLIATFKPLTFIDATLGKGNDAYYILNHPDFKGFVYGFDIQATAIEWSQQKLASLPTHSAQSYRLIHDSHSQITHYVAEEVIHGAIFNLGYLPGGDHHITTQIDSTLAAITAISQKLAVHGQIILVVYSGHPAGLIEKQHLLEVLSEWPQELYQVAYYGFINQINEPPCVIVIERIK